MVPWVQSIRTSEKVLIRSVDSKEPSFLRKLKAEHGGEDSVRHERPQARPRKQPMGPEDDDLPTYVVEGTQDTLSKEEYEALSRENGEGERQLETVPVKGNSNGAPDAQILEKDEDGEVNTISTVANTEKNANIGVSNKRRMVKAFGGGDDTDNHGHEGEKYGKELKKGKRKKGKKVKLSFDKEAASE